MPWTQTTLTKAKNWNHTTQLNHYYERDPIPFRSTTLRHPDLVMYNRFGMLILMYNTNLVPRGPLWRDEYEGSSVPRVQYSKDLSTGVNSTNDWPSRLLEIKISFLKLIEIRRILRWYYSVRDAKEATHLDGNIENYRSRKNFETS